jgi:glycosyltransferase involved in cell wall biosynthesis
MTLHGSDVHGQLHIKIIGRLLAAAYRHANRIICVSQNMKEDIDTLYPSLKNITVSIPNGYNSDEIYFLNQKRGNYLLFVGQLIPRKNVHVLLHAFANIKDKVSYELIIAGGGPQKYYLEELADKLFIKDRVSFLGDVKHSDLNPLYNQANALILPSWGEGMPIVVLEALATGTPVIASRIAGNPELITSKDVGLLVEPNSVASLQNAICELSKMSLDYAYIAEKNKNASWQTNAQKIYKLYEDELNKA